MRYMSKVYRKRKSAAFDPIDIYVGSRLRMCREHRGISQTKLGDAVGVSFQQLQKYEKGANRMGASRLHEISKILDVPVSFFFDDMPEELERKRATASPGDPMARRDVRELIDAYYAIGDKDKQKALFEMVKAIARSANG